MTVVRALAVVGLLAAIVACDSGGIDVPAATVEAPPVSDSVRVTSSLAPPDDDLRQVFDAGALDGFWVPVEVDGERVATNLGAFWLIRGEGERISIEGYDGCNAFRAWPLAHGPPPRRVDGARTTIGAEQHAGACDWRTARAIPTTGSMFWISDDGAEIVVEPTEHGGRARMEHVDERPVNARQERAQEEAAAEQAALDARERAEREAAEAAELENRARIERELPDARSRWVESGTTDYTMRFEVGALRVDPSFPQRRPVGGVWEIVVIDGVALDNEWADSVLGDTVDDWFDYVESQLDSHYLHVEFDLERGFPTVIDSQPLGAEDVSDTNEIVAWLVRAEIGPPLPADRDPDAPEPGLVRLDDLEPLDRGFWDPDSVAGGPAAFLDSVYWTISHDAATGAVSISGFDGCNQWDLVAASDRSGLPRLEDGILDDVGVPPEAGDCPPGNGVLTSYPVEGSEFWYDPFGNRFVITPTTGGVSLGFRRLHDLPAAGDGN